MLLDVFHQILYAKRKPSAHLNKLNDQVPIKASLVALADTITDPRTVMVVRCHALIAWLAVFGSQWLLEVANRTIFALNKQLNVFIRFIWLCLLIIILTCFIYCFHLDAFSRSHSTILLCIGRVFGILWYSRVLLIVEKAGIAWGSVYRSYHFRCLFNTWLQVIRIVIVLKL